MLLNVIMTILFIMPLMLNRLQPTSFFLLFLMFIMPLMLNRLQRKRVDLPEKLSFADFVVLPDGTKKGVELLRIDRLVLSDDALKILQPI